MRPKKDIIYKKILCDPRSGRIVSEYRSGLIWNTFHVPKSSFHRGIPHVSKSSFRGIPLSLGFWKSSNHVPRPRSLLPSSRELGDYQPRQGGSRKGSPRGLMSVRHMSHWTSDRSSVRIWRYEQSNDQSMNHCQHFRIQSEFVREKKKKNTQRELGRMKWNCVTKTGLADDATMQWMDVSENELTKETSQNSVA